MVDSLVAAVDRREAVVGVVGLGYVGLPLVFAFTDAGFRTVGFDIDESKIKSLDAGRTYIKHLPDERIAAINASETA